MTSRIHSNNYLTTLNGSITAIATSIVVSSLTNFPVIGAGVTCNLTLQNGSDIEIIQVTSNSSTTLAVVRGFEGTSGLIFPSGSTVSLRPTADSIDRKQDILTGGASTIASSNLTANRSLISNASGKVAVSATTDTELGYVSGVTSAIQAQLNAITSIATAISGFVSWGGSGNYFDDTVIGSFTISRPGTGLVNNILTAWAAPQTITGLTAATTWFIYVDSSGIIQKTSNVNSALNLSNIPLFACLRDSTAGTNHQLTAKDNHPATFPSAVNQFAENVMPPLLSELEVGATIAASGTTKIQIVGSNTMYSGSVSTIIPDSAGSAVSFYQYFTLAGGAWARYTSSDTFGSFYNNAGTVTALPGGKFGVYTLYATMDNLTTSTPSYIAVLDTTNYGSSANAQSAITSGTTAKASNELLNLPLVRLGYIIFSQGSGTITTISVSKQVLISSSTTTTSTPIATVQYNSLVGGASNTVQSVAPSSTTGIALVSQGSSANPAFDTVVVAGGGTGVTSASITAFNNITGYSASGATGTTSTNLVFSTSPTLVTPLLGTPTSGNLANCTGYPLSAYATLANPTFTGTVVLPSGQALIAPALGTVASGVISACTSTSMVMVSPLLGTPTSGVLTNCTGLPVAGGGTGIATQTAYSVLVGGTTATGAMQSLASIGTLNQVLTSQGPSALPIWSTLATPVTGPGSATDKAVAIYNGTGGSTIQNSVVIITSGAVTGVTSLTASSFILAAANVKIWQGAQNDSTSTGCGTQTLNSTNNASATNNSGFGYLAGNAINTGAKNTCIGASSGGALSGGSENTFVGYVAGGSTNGSSFNTSIGSSSVTGAGQNTCIGALAGNTGATGGVALSNSGGAADNTLVGYRATCDTSSAVGCLALGEDAVAAKATGTTSITIGPGIAIGSAARPVGFAGDGTMIQTAGSSSGYWRVKVNGTHYKILMFADS